MNVNEAGELTVHQSDLEKFLQCPDQFRVMYDVQPGGDFTVQRVLDPMDDKPHWRPHLNQEGDAALIGKICHKAFEIDVRDSHFTSLAQLKNWAKRQWKDSVRCFLETGIPFLQESYGTDEKAIAAMLAVLERWWKSTERSYWLMAMQDHGDRLHFEKAFRVPLIEGREGRYANVFVGGEIDLLDQYSERIVDYKTASRPYTRWEKQRWAVQPTVYTFGAASLGLLKPHDDGTYQFDYRVFVKGEKGEPQSLTVHRGPDQWGWLIQQTTNMIELMESEVKRWPLRDDGWWCSGKWCPVWKDCKGAFVTEEWT